MKRTVAKKNIYIHSNVWHFSLNNDRCPCTAASSDVTKSTSLLKKSTSSRRTLSSRLRRASSNTPQNFTVYYFRHDVHVSVYLLLVFWSLSGSLLQGELQYLPNMHSIFHVALVHAFSLFLQCAFNRSHLTGSMLVQFLLFEKGGRESKIKCWTHYMQLAMIS